MFTVVMINVETKEETMLGEFENETIAKAFMINCKSLDLSKGEFYEYRIES